MQCENCGRPLRPEETICPNCGEPVWPETTDQPTFGARRTARPGALQVGPPVDPFAPTVYGPQAPPRNFTSPPYGIPDGSLAPSPSHEYPGEGSRPIWPSPATPPRRGRGAGCLPLVGVLAALAVVVLLVVGALAASGQFPGGLAGNGGQQSKISATHAPTLVPTATATPAPACPLKPVDATAAKAVRNVQLTSGLKNFDHNDFRPINNLKTFHAGQTVYVTFQVATSQAGTVAADICTVGNRVTGSKSVPHGFQDARGEFNTPNPLSAPQDIGDGAVILTWDGAVVAALPFQVAIS